MLKISHFLSIFLLFACTSDDLEFAFEMDYPNQSFEIAAGLNPFVSHFYLINDIPTAKGFFFGDFQEEDITEIAATRAILRSREGISINFGFLEEVSVRICTERPISERDAQQKCGREREIFYRDNIPPNIRDEVELLPNSLNVKELLTKEEFSVLVVLRRMRDFPSTTINTRFDMRFQARQ
ncbi:MAG: hypothetical protein AAF738_05480 [Bacteroidota bacterium]